VTLLLLPGVLLIAAVCLWLLAEFIHDLPRLLIACLMVAAVHFALVVLMLAVVGLLGLIGM
jgi:hypothetical protein